MIDKLIETTNQLGLKLPHLMGAGAISMAMANKHRSKDFYPKIRAVNHLPVQDWAHHTFAGGNIQMILQGRAPFELDEGGKPIIKIWGFDITSAYPSKQYKLPAMALPIEWELRKDGSIRKVTKSEGKWIWREGAELNEDIIKMMSCYSILR
jgi:hypothetical protein